MRVPDSVTWKDLDSGMVLLDLTNGTYQLLNDTAAAIWRWIVDGKTSEEMVEALVAEYDCAPPQARTDTEELLEYLKGRHLIEA